MPITIEELNEMLDECPPVAAAPTREGALLLIFDDGAIVSLRSSKQNIELTLYNQDTVEANDAD